MSNYRVFVKNRMGLLTCVHASLIAKVDNVLPVGDNCTSGIILRYDRGTYIVSRFPTTRMRDEAFKKLDKTGVLYPHEISWAIPDSDALKHLAGRSVPTDAVKRAILHAHVNYLKEGFDPLEYWQLPVVKGNKPQFLHLKTKICLDPLKLSVGLPFPKEYARYCSPLQYFCYCLGVPMAEGRNLSL